MTARNANVQVDPLQAHQTWNAWAALPADVKGSVKMTGTQLLDGASYGLLKAEFLAATAGVVPWIPLPGGGKGVMTVGAALEQPATAWPQAELRHLYMLNQNAYATLHARVTRARGGTPTLRAVPVSPMDAQSVAAFYNAVGSGASTMGIPQVAFIILAAVGILATIAGAYYATRTRLEEIQVDAKSARDAAAIGSLTDLASRQLTLTGKIDPNLVKAIKEAGTETAGSTVGYIAIGAGSILALATGIYLAFKVRKHLK